ncbi:sulfite exporter TauE/SafE family protein [Parafrankia elaeagni]|uniref:sulfite exporter TauE/SafE family protein n=1 Tax=Parafrankia elaeagni TaxID=222534 RepID=UPI000369B7DA|nr:sulfite exporter TauE/SafE family protein [Parafrankia elaeagni]
MEPSDAALVAGGGLLAGAVNAIAGGGTLIAFPALLATGMPALTANITSSVGLLTGYAGGAFGYRRELRGQAHRLRALAPPALFGGLVGAIVLLLTPSDGFKRAVPFLVLAACLLLAVQSRLAAVVARRRAATVASAPSTASVTASRSATAVTPAVAGNDITWPTRIGVFVAGVYGSYFGAGLGVLLLGVLGILLVDELQRTNALKTLLSFGVNAVGVLIFLVAAQVSWAFAGILVVTSACGGVLGARAARLLPATVLRTAVVILGVVVAVVLLVR